MPMVRVSNGGTSFIEPGNYKSFYGSGSTFTMVSGTFSTSNPIVVVNGKQSSLFANVSGFTSVTPSTRTSYSGGCTLDKDFNLVTSNIPTGSAHTFLSNEVYFVFGMSKESPDNATFTFN